MKKGLTISQLHIEDKIRLNKNHPWFSDLKNKIGVVKAFSGPQFMTADVKFGRATAEVHDGEFTMVAPPKEKIRVYKIEDGRTLLGYMKTNLRKTKLESQFVDYCYADKKEKTLAGFLRFLRKKNQFHSFEPVEVKNVFIL